MSPRQRQSTNLRIRHTNFSHTLLEWLLAKMVKISEKLNQLYNKSTKIRYDQKTGKFEN